MWCVCTSCLGSTVSSECYQCASACVFGKSSDKLDWHWCPKSASSRTYGDPWASRRLGTVL
eukprot:5293469-Pyramimonas_sp.AAC.1